MINEFYIKNFKSHESTRIKLGNLTVLCGQNGVGKSSVIQALLLLRQTYQKMRLHSGLDLNKPLCEVGTAQDALYQFAKDNILQLTIDTSENGQYDWEFLFDDVKSKNTFMDIVSFSGDRESFEKISLFNKYFQYLSAARWSPKISYPKDNYEVEYNRQISLDKGQGELVAHFLDYYGNEDISFSYCMHPDCSEQTLIKQTTAWEKEISQDINVHLVESGHGYELFYNFSRDETFPTNNFNAENVGFGVSYTLPIIVALLSAQKDSLILIENPEAHLHPYAQSKLAQLICLAAQNGVQIVIETHSDHIINGILVATKQLENGNKGIDKALVNMYYFNRDKNRHTVDIKQVNIEEDGKIDSQPSGFFDQIQADLKYIMGF